MAIWNHSLTDPSKNGQVKVFEAVSKLKDLVAKNEKQQQFDGKTEQVNSRNHNGSKTARAIFLLW